MRTTSTNTYLVSDKVATQHDLDAGIAVFTFNYTDGKGLFNESQYYRVQLAFMDNDGEVGYYSTVGIIKCVAKPTIWIDKYEATDVNMFDTTFIGRYKQNTTFGDSTEKVYSYLFNIFDEDGNVLATSGEKIHDITSDTQSDESEDIWTTHDYFKDGILYYLQYTVTTLNGLVISSVKYKIMKIISIPTEYDIKIHANVDYENGFIDVTLQGEVDSKEALEDSKYQILSQYAKYDPDQIYFIKVYKEETEKYIYEEFLGTLADWNIKKIEHELYINIKSEYRGEKAYSGQFIITRSSSETSFTEWIEVARFSLQSQQPSTVHYRDCTVQQGIEYKYALQQFNIHNMYSRKTYQTDMNGKENTTIADFEDLFLSDGERQLRVRFNPKVKKFTNTIPEKKLETIGSKYPFVFRNGSVLYKEFSIDGLISYKMDETKMFLTIEEMKEAGILEYDYGRGITSIDFYNKTVGHEQSFYYKKIENDIRDPYTNKKLYTEIYYVMSRYPKEAQIKYINNFAFKTITVPYNEYEDKLPDSFRERIILTQLNNLRTPQQDIFDYAASLVGKDNNNRLKALIKAKEYFETREAKEELNKDVMTAYNKIINSEIKDKEIKETVFKIIYQAGSKISHNGLTETSKRFFATFEGANMLALALENIKNEEILRQHIIRLNKHDYVFGVYELERALAMSDDDIDTVVNNENYHSRNTYGAVDTAHIKTWDQIVYETKHKIIQMVSDYSEDKISNDLINEILPQYFIRRNYAVKRDIIKSQNEPSVRSSTNLTSDNIMGERYFKLKVLEWLTNGKIKLFRSATEGNYLVRLTKVSLKPNDKLGRMLHSFSCTAFEMDEVTYDNLVGYGIITPKVSSNIEEQWGTVDVRAVLKSVKPNKDGFVKVSPDDISMNTVLISHFAPGDQIKLIFNEDNDPEHNIFTVGVTGSLELNNDDRKIIEVWVKINPDENLYNDFERELTYSFTSITMTKFDTISNISVLTRTAEQFIGPKDNLLEAFNLRHNAYGIPDEEGVVETPLDKITGFNNIYQDLKDRNRLNYNIEKLKNMTVEKFATIKIDILHVWKKDLIPIFAYKTKQEINSNTQYGLNERLIPIVKELIREKTDLTQLNTEEIEYFKTMKKISDEEYTLLYNNNNNKQEFLNSMIEYDTLYRSNIYVGITPFNQGYVNNKTILDYIEYTSKGIKFKQVIPPEQVVKLNENFQWIDTEKIAINDLYTIQKAAGFHNDDSVIYQLFVFDNETQQWEASSIPGLKYYDNYRRSWFEGITKFDPTFSINAFQQFNYYDNENAMITQDINIIGDNNISLNEVNEITLYNLGDIEQLHLGNGVIAEVTPQMRIVDYDIESSNYSVRKAKNAYLQAKEDYKVALDSVKVEVGDTSLLKANQDILARKIKNLEKQIQTADLQSNYEVAELAAKERMVEQKKRLWTNKYGIVLEIVKYLKNTCKVYDELDGSSAINPLKNYSFTNDLTSISNMSRDLSEKTIRIEQNEAQDGDNFNVNTRGGLLLKQLPSSIKYIDNEPHDFINTSEFIDTKYFTYESENYQRIIEEYEAQIRELQAQQGELVGGLLEDYDETNKPPENTLVYYDYLLAELDKKYLDELNKLNRQKASLVNELLQIKINQTTDILNNIQEATGEYLSKNAITLINLLSSYKNDKQQKISAIENQYYIPDISMAIFGTNEPNNDQRNDILAMTNKTLSMIVVNSNTYTDPTTSKIYEKIGQKFSPVKNLQTLYSEIAKGNINDLKTFIIKNLPYPSSYINAYDVYCGPLKVEVETLNKEIKALESIRDYPGVNGRQYKTDPAFANTSFLNNWNNSVDTIKNTYIKEAEQQINTWLANNPYDLKNLVFVTSDNQPNSRAFAILDLFTDDLNATQAQTIKTSLNKYYPADNDARAKELVVLIKNKDALYAKKLVTLNNLQQKYYELKANIQLEIDNIGQSISVIENRKLQTALEKSKADDQLSLAEKQKDVIESEYLLNKLVNNNDLIIDIDVLQKYLNWVGLHQENLIKYAGQVYGNIKTGLEYSTLLKQYIDAYEEEAFYFLHKYDSILQDLQAGFDTDLSNIALSPGIDRYAYNLDKYWITVYQNILYIIDKEIDLTTYNTLAPKLESPNDEIRFQAYKDLLEYLERIFLGIKKEQPGVEKDPTNITFGLVYKGEDWQIVRLISSTNDNSIDGEIFPNVYTLGSNSAQLNQITSSGWEMLNGYTLQRNIFDNSNVTPIALEPIDNVYIKNKYNTSQRYYTLSGDEYILTLQAANLSDENFNLRVHEINSTLYWMAPNKPVSVTIDLHPYLYEIATNKFSVNSNFLITPTWVKYLDNFIGAIVHDYSNEQNQQADSEYGSYFKLREQDTEIFKIISEYFQIQKTLILNTTNQQDIKEYEKHNKLLEDYNLELSKWDYIVSNCQDVKDGYDVEQIPDTDGKKQQLIAIINIAYEKVQYYAELIRQEKKILDALLQKDNNQSLTIYFSSLKMKNELEESLNKAQQEYSDHFEIYQAKVRHYLQLLFNETPYGTRMDRDIVHNKSILKINGKDTRTYNLGIIYAIEKFKKYKKELFGPIQISDAIAKANDFINMLTINFQLLVKLTTENNYNPNSTYYIRDLVENSYKRYFYTSQEEWDEYIRKGFLYYTDYPCLCEFVNFREFIKVTDNMQYRQNQVYFIEDNGNFIEYNVPDENIFMLDRDALFIESNGGLKTILNYLADPKSKYLQEIQKNYLDTIELLEKLESQQRGDTLTRDELIILLRQNQKEYNDLTEKIKRLSEITINSEAYIDEITQKLAEYLRVLTLAYIYDVERKYDII